MTTVASFGAQRTPIVRRETVPGTVSGIRPPVRSPVRLRSRSADGRSFDVRSVRNVLSVYSFGKPVHAFGRRRQPRDLVDMLHEWIPKELLDRILTLAGPLAQFLHGRMRVSLQSSAVISLMWAECFVADMVAAVPLLPRPAVILGWELLLVHSRRMVRAIKAEMLPGISQWMDLAKTGLQPAFDASDLTEIRSLVRDANRSSVQAGRLVLVHHLLRLYPLYNRPITEISNSNVMQLIVWAAAASGDAAIIRSLLISDLNESIGRTKTPASARHRSAVRVAQHEAAAAAAEFGHLHIVEILCKAVPTTAGAAVQGAVWGGHLSIVQFIAERFPTAFWPPSLTASIRLHRSDILIWLLQHTELRDLACCASIKNDCLQHLNIDVLRFAFEHRIGRPVDPWQLAAVAEQGRLDILQLVFEHEPTIEWPPSILERAIRGQQLVVLKWLHTLGVAGDTVMIMWLAVFYGALEIVRWTHEELGQPFGVDALDFAIQQRHVDVVRFLLERGCRPTLQMFASAARSGRLEVMIALLRSHGKTSSSSSSSSSFSRAIEPSN